MEERFSRLVALHPFRHQADDRLGSGTEFGGGGIFDAGKVTGRFHDRHLHAEADTEIGHVALTRELRRHDLAFGTTLTETTRHENAVDLFEIGCGIFLFEDLGLDPFQLDLDAIGKTTVMQRLDQRLVGILEAGVFADDRNRHFAFRRADAVADLFPRLQTRLGRRLDAEGGQHFRIETFLVVGNRNVIDIRHIQRLDDGGRTHVAEQRKLAAFRFRDFPVGAHKQDVGVNAERLQFLHGMLGRLCLQLAGCRNVRHQRQVKIDRRAARQVVAEPGGSPP